MQCTRLRSGQSKAGASRSTMRQPLRSTRFHCMTQKYKTGTFRHRIQCAVVLCWASILLLAQAAAFAHAVLHGLGGDDHHNHVRTSFSVHAHGHPRVHGGADQHAHDEGERHVHHAGGWLAHLMHGSHDDGGCKLFEAAGQGFLPGTPGRVPAAICPPRSVLAYLHGEALARWAALFDARGPPALSLA